MMLDETSDETGTASRIIAAPPQRAARSFSLNALKWAVQGSSRSSVKR